MRANRWQRCLLTVALLANAGQLAAAQPDDDASFTETVAPLLVQRCGACHIQQACGGLSMTTYATLLKGSNSGRVIRRRSAERSRLIELISDGTMPKEGEPLSEPEVQAISRWIDAGAKFDGRNPRSPLTAFARSNTSPTTAPPKGAPRPSRGSVSFSKVIAPLLVENCTGCHGADRPRAGLSMANFQRLSAGGDSGPPFVATKPDESLLIAKLKGTADGARMPADSPPLSDERIGQVEKWIAAGARFDAADPGQPLEQVVEIALAGSMTHAQLSARRAEFAAHNWRLALPDVAPARLETDTLRLWGNVAPAELASVAQLAEAERKKVARILKPPRGIPFIHGRLTLFVYNRRFEYAEFGLMVEGRELPPGQTGHWRHNTLDAYGCLAFSPDGLKTTLPPLLNRQLAGAYLASHAGVPTWLADGCSRVVVARCHPKDSQIRSWQQSVTSALAGKAIRDKFFTADTFSGDLEAISYGFAAHLMSNSRRFQRLLGQLRDGGDFAQSFAQAYGVDPQQAFDAWATRAAAGG